MSDENFLPHSDEIRLLFLKVIEQSIRDYLTLEKSSAPIEQQYYEEACEFLFDPEYIIEWGGADKSLEQVLEILDIDDVWFHQKLMKVKDRKYREMTDRRKAAVNEGKKK